MKQLILTLIACAATTLLMAQNAKAGRGDGRAVDACYYRDVYTACSLCGLAVHAPPLGWQECGSDGNDYKNMKEMSAVFEIFKTKNEQYFTNSGARLAHHV